MRDYQFARGDGQMDAAIAPGHGALYNPSYRPNAKFFERFEHHSTNIVCLEHIQESEQILPNYNGGPEERAPVWPDAA